MYIKRALSTVLLCLFLSMIPLSLYLSHIKSTSAIRAALTKIPAEDKKVLESFFREMQERDSMTYVVFGSKPMMLTSFNQFLQEAKQYPFNETLRKGWVTWKKYEKFFPHPNFILRIFGNLEKDDEIDIILINKRNFIKEFKQYPEEYKLLIETGSIESWLECFSTQSRSFSGSFHHNPVLKGIGFGFGRHNAYLFQKNWAIYEALLAKYPAQDPDFIDALYDQAEGKLPHSWFVDNDLKAQNIMRLPRCATDTGHPETISLQKRYEKDRKKIIKLLEKQDFLESVLNALSSDS